MRVALTLSVTALLVSLATLAYASVRNHERAADIERTRQEAMLRTCRLENDQALAIQAFVTSVAPRLEVRVARAFAVKTCK
jgi:hypothetical protein